MDELEDQTTEEETQANLIEEPEAIPSEDQVEDSPPPPDDPEEAQQGYLRDADYRKKTMSLADERRDFEAEKGKLQEDAQRWEMFQKDANYRQAVIGMVNGANGAAQSQTTAEPQDAPDVSQFDPEHIEIVKHIVKQAIAETVQPQLDQGKNWIQQQQSRSVATGWADLKKAHPEATKYENEVVSFLQANPSVESLEQAFFAVAGKDLMSKRQVLAKRQDSDARRDAQVTPTTVSSQAVAPAMKKTLAEIVTEEMDKQRA